ncbi:ComF family protein [Nocardioides sp. SYSU DS0651]|uniref:ComF family protein n=1 Tax=Nocardioides sp. SYSU DS0651 TaxID=3415955 RepID=UPI003F4B7177
MPARPMRHDPVRVLPMLADGLVDLLLGSACVGCGRPGRVLCEGCRGSLPDGAALAWPSPVPPGLVPPFATGPYDAVVRAMVLAHKEKRALALARPLGGLLAQAAAVALDSTATARDDPVVLVPVPSRPAAVRQRGHDATLAMTRFAVRALVAAGRPATVGRLLRLRPGVADQSGLDARGRAANLAGSMTAPARLVRRLGERVPRAHVVVCDDVLTTGATLREAQRALESAGLAVRAAAAVAATARRVPPPRSAASLPPSPPTD